MPKQVHFISKRFAARSAADCVGFCMYLLVSKCTLGFMKSSHVIFEAMVINENLATRFASDRFSTNVEGIVSVSGRAIRESLATNLTGERLQAFVDVLVEMKR